MTINNNFLVSVAKAIGRDANTGEGIFLAKANISSAFSLSTTAVEVRGGVGNPLLYVFYHSRKVEIKLDSATFDKQFLGLNVGQLTQNGSVVAVMHECLTLANSVGTCSQVPVSDVICFMSDGTIQDITPVGSNFTTVGGANTSIDVVYNYYTTADQITVATETPPSVVDLTLIAEVRNSTGVIVNYLQINIPRFQISGNYTLSLAANGVSSQQLEGYALAVYSSDCVTGDYFAKVTYVTPVAATVSTASIVAMPSTLEFLPSVAGSGQITTLGIRGTSTVNVTTSCSYASSSGSFIVGLHTGLVTVSASNANLGSSGSIVVTYWDDAGSGSRTDSVNLIVMNAV